MENARYGVLRLFLETKTLDVAWSSPLYIIYNVKEGNFNANYQSVDS